MGIKVPKAPYCFATVSDWYMAIEITGGREPLSIVWRIVTVSPRRESNVATRMDVGFLGRMNLFSVDWVGGLDVSTDIDEMLEVFPMTFRIANDISESSTSSFSKP